MPERPRMDKRRRHVMLRVLPRLDARGDAMMDARPATISVRQNGDGDPIACSVEVDGTSLDVTLAQGDLDRLGAGRSAAEVVTAAFRFLLDREPRDAILRRFDLGVIARYFPEFEQEFPGYIDRVGGSGGATGPARSPEKS